MIKKAYFLLSLLYMPAHSLAQTTPPAGQAGQETVSQPVPGTAPNPAGPVATSDTVTSLLPPAIVTRIKVQHPSSTDATNNGWIGKRNDSVAYTGNVIQFQLSNPLAFLNSKPGDQARVVLYVDGVEMPGITSDSKAANATTTATVNAQAAAEQAIKETQAKAAQDALLQAAKKTDDPNKKL